MRELDTLNQQQLNQIDGALLDIISYRKSGLSLNHIIGCSFDCAYCVRHFFGNFDMKEPSMICSDEDAVFQLVNHKFFIPDVTPIQIFNRATDPFLKKVKPHLFAVLDLLDTKGLKNNILIITRGHVSSDDIDKLESFKNLKITLLLTYSGIADPNIEPIVKNNVTVNSIRRIHKYKNRVRLVLYWRPIVAGWNDDDESIDRALNAAKYADAIVYTGYYHRPENAEHLRKIGIYVPDDDYARRKLMPQNLEKKILDRYRSSGLNVPMFRKTSCGVSFVQNVADYNGHWGVNELCDICPDKQKEICRNAYKTPTIQEFESLLNKYDYDTTFNIDDGHIWTEGLGEEKRYHLQHILGYQIWDIMKPHFKYQHGRSPAGQNTNNEYEEWYQAKKENFFNNLKPTND